MTVHPLVQQTVRLPVRCSTALVIVPPKPCGLVACVGEIEVTVRGTATPIRVHLDGAQRDLLVRALGGVPAYDADLADRLEHNGGR